MLPVLSTQIFILKAPVQVNRYQIFINAQVVTVASSVLYSYSFHWNSEIDW